MKHLVMICGVYYPNSSATGKCAEQYISLLENEFNIDVIYISSDLYDVTSHHFGNQWLYPQTNKRMRGEQWFEQKQKNSSKLFAAKWYAAGCKTLKIVGRIQTYLFFPNSLRWFYKKAFKQLKLIQQKYSIDVIFSVSSPYSSHLAAKKFKSKFSQAIWAGYTVDPYSSVNALHPIYLTHNKTIAHEAECLAKMDVCFMSEELISNRSELIKLCDKKVVPLPYLLPNLINISKKANGIHFDPNKINLVYAGSFYQKIRNPKFMLNSIAQIKKSGIVLHLYSSGDCDSIVEEYTENENSNIVLHGKVPYDEILKIYDEADVLVSVANTTAELSPSKLFEYIATGKPIIEFNSGINIGQYSKQYPLFLEVLACQNSEKVVNQIIEFCRLSKGMRVSEEQIAELYKKHLPESIRHTLLSKLYINK